MWQVYAIYAAVDWQTLILKDMLSFETAISWNLERLRSYVVKSIWLIIASGDAC